MIDCVFGGGDPIEEEFWESGASCSKFMSSDGVIGSSAPKDIVVKQYDTGKAMISQCVISTKIFENLNEVDIASVVRSLRQNLLHVQISFAVDWSSDALDMIVR